jgi:hypothetical protein
MAAPGRAWVFRSGLAAVALIAIAARVAAARGDLWLDEIWSIRFAELAGSAAGVFTRLHHDNNHHLNTLWALVVGDGGPALAYRLVAVVSAGATLALVALRPLRGGRFESLAATVLVGASFFLVQYGSEARGYAPAIFFATAAYLALDAHLRTRRRTWAAAFAAAAVLGILSHLTFLFILCGLLAWAAVEIARARRPLDPIALALLAVPVVALGALWLVDLREVAIGGGPPYDVFGLLRELLAAVFGLPRGPLELLAAIPLLAAAYELVALARARDGRAVFFAVAFLAPAALIAVHRPAFLATRYFAVCVVPLLVLCAASLARLARRGLAGRVAAILLLAAFAGANALPVRDLVRDGRGRYREAIAFLVASAPPGRVSVGSDHDFRNGIVLAYHARDVSGWQRLDYVPAGEWRPGSPEWVFRHDLTPGAVPEPRFIGENGRAYALVRSFPHAGLSGWTWSLYRLEP